jgi:hypothetical protein
VKHSGKIFVLFIIFGIIFLALVLVGTYLGAIDALTILVLFSPTKLGFGFMLGGIILLIVGIFGIKRSFFRSHGTFVQAFSIPLFSSFLFITFIFAISWIVISAPMYPMRSEITQITVVDDSPLVLSLTVKAITSRDTRIDSALVLDSDDAIVASYCNEEVMVEGVSTFEPICVLSGGSEITFTVDFSTTLPSGNYLVKLSSWHDNHGESLFTIP